ncbi:MAG: glycosyltransferase family 2 protein [Candidatus Humimicrobiaceae bacterium]
MDNAALIIVVTYNSENFIEKCLFSIASQNFRNYFLLVIDNKSSDLTVDRIKEYKNAESRISSSNFKLIKLEKNIGFSGAVNYGVFEYFSNRKKAGFSDFKYLILLNPDMVFDENTISNLIDTFNIQAGNQRNDTGVAGGMILDYQKNRVSHIGGKVEFNFITSHLKVRDGLNMEGIISGKLEADRTGADFISADYVTGALFATKMAIFRKLGGFDTGYRPAYFEELDYCLKLKRSGFKVLVNPYAFARHFEGASIGKFTPQFYYYYHKNRLRCAIINSSLINILKIFFKSEANWLKSGAAGSYKSSLAKAYLINWLFCPYYLIIKIRNIIKISGLKKIVLS